MVFPSLYSVPSPEKRERMRASTVQAADVSERARKQARLSQMKRHPKQPELRRLTQDELLAEAVVTEEENLASLAHFLKEEAEKKKAVFKKVRGEIHDSDK